MMLLLALLSTLVAVWCGVPGPPPRDLGGRLAASPEPLARSTARRWGRWGALLGTVGSVAAVALVWGPRAAVITAAVALAGWTVVGLAVQHRRRTRERRAEVAVARACTVLAAHLRVGQVAAEALALTAVDCPVLAEAYLVQRVGGDVARTWRRQAQRGGHGGLLDLARAWQVSTETGAPMSATLDQVAASLSADQVLRAVVSSELAAPRASGKVMAALPACGIGLGYLIGGDPVDWLLGGPLGWACLLGGVASACAGVWWIEALARRATT
jgi:tight adherence protein B